jgi:hypothetical protein
MVAIADPPNRGRSQFKRQRFRVRNDIVVAKSMRFDEFVLLHDC